MAWIAEFPELDRDQARKALNIPIGMASPLWLAFGAATTAGVAWWWMTRWTRALNVEAIAGAAKVQVGPTEAFIESESEIATHAVEAFEAVLEAVAATQTVAPAPEPVADDLTRLTGIGPKLAAALAERGVTTFSHLAAWTDAQAKAFDAELSLKGRVARDAWVAQAKRLAAA